MGEQDAPGRADATAGQPGTLSSRVPPASLPIDKNGAAPPPDPWGERLPRSLGLLSAVAVLVGSTIGKILLQR